MRNIDHGKTVESYCMLNAGGIANIPVSSSEIHVLCLFCCWLYGIEKDFASTLAAHPAMEEVVDDKTISLLLPPSKLS